jgi:hypothetical protein
MSFLIYPFSVPIEALASCPAPVLCPFQYLSPCSLSSLGLEPMQQTDIIPEMFFSIALLEA